MSSLSIQTHDPFKSIQNGNGVGRGRPLVIQLLGSKSRVFVAGHRISENSKPRGSSSCLYQKLEETQRLSFLSKGWKPSCLFYSYLEALEELVTCHEQHQSSQARYTIFKTLNTSTRKHFHPQLNTISRKESIVFI